MVDTIDDVCVALLMSVYSKHVCTCLSYIYIRCLFISVPTSLYVKWGGVGLKCLSGVCMCMSVCARVRSRLCALVCVCARARTRVCVCVCVCVCVVYICVPVCIPVSLCLCVYVSVYIQCGDEGST